MRDSIVRYRSDLEMLATFEHLSKGRKNSMLLKARAWVRGGTSLSPQVLLSVKRLSTMRLA